MARPAPRALVHEFYKTSAAGDITFGPGPVDRRPIDTIGARVTPYSHAGWTGTVETYAAKRRGVDADAPTHQSIASVTVFARRGVLVALIRWHGGAGSDLEGAIRRGERAVAVALDRLAAA